ncbi:MAG: right-handed parallel beta-helix repeat-containing protein [Lentisphaeria bacterium]
MKRIIALAILLCLTATAHAATYYYSRDGNGAATGADYANRGAYKDANELLCNSVAAGDSVYLCGNWVNTTAIAKTLVVGKSGTAANVITIRGDYEDDPGILYNFRGPYGGTWSGPDGNGYHLYSKEYSGLVACYLGDANLEHILPLATLSREDPNILMLDTDANGFAFGDTGTFVKLSDGADPNNGLRVYPSGAGYRFGIANQSYITFKELTFWGFPLDTTSTPGYANATHITWDTCTARYASGGNSYLIYGGFGNDDWTFVDCEFSHAPGAVGGVGSIAWLDDPNIVNTAPSRWTIRGGHFHHFGWQAGWAYYDADAHAIGNSNASNWTVDGVEIDHCCSAVEFFQNWNNPSGDNTFVNNFIHDTEPNHAITNAGGITVYKGSATIRNNIFLNIGGSAVSAAVSEQVIVENNTIYNANLFPDYWGARGAIFIRNGVVRNNIVKGCKYFVYRDSNSVALTVNWNYFVGDPTTADFYALGTGTRTAEEWQGLGYDAHSTFTETDPGWAVADPNTREGFRVNNLSPVWKSGTMMSGLDPNGVRMNRTAGAYGYIPERFGVKQ